MEVRKQEEFNLVAKKLNNFLTHDPTFEIFLLVHSNILTLKNQVASPKGKPAAFSQMPPSPPYRAPCTWQTCTMAQLPQLHARCTNPLQQCFPPQLPISHGSVFRQAAVFRVNHPTLVVAARTRGGKSVHWSWSRIGGEAAPSTISCCPRGGDGGCNCCSVVCAVTAT